ncbi:MAG: hypothetical protein MI861_23575, partial [Pirellulales bacterium]|nr:hypothetical protein [Pirellulales bacterium]
MIVLGWTLIACSPELQNTLTPNLQWYATLLAVPALLVLSLPKRLWRGSPGLTAALGLTLALVLSAVATPEPLRAAVHAVKVGVVWLLWMPLLFARPTYARTALFGCLLAAGVNFAMILAAAAGVLDAAAPSGAGRWGTVLNAPGTLAQLGGFALAISAARLAAEPKLRLSQAGLAAAAMALIVLDGSRTAFLGAFGVVAFLAATGHRRAGAGEPSVRRTAQPWVWAGSAALTASVAAVWLLWEASPFSGSDGSRGLQLVAAQRIETIIERTRGVEGLTDLLERADKPRYRAMLDSIEAIRRNPLRGEGLDSTRSEGHTQQITIHNAYLQSWAD